MPSELYQPQSTLQALISHMISQHLLPPLPTAITESFLNIDRADFVSPQQLEKGMQYNDQPLPIGENQTISAPHMHCHSAKLLESYITRPNARILDVGSGSGYLSAVFADCARRTGGGKVLGIEYFQPLVIIGNLNVRKSNPDLLDIVGKSPALSIIRGDGWHPQSQPLPPPFDADDLKFDCIHVGAAAASMPEALVALMKNDSRMLIPIGPEYCGGQFFTQVDKDADGTMHQKELMEVRYVPLIQGGVDTAGWKEGGNEGGKAGGNKNMSSQSDL